MISQQHSRLYFALAEKNDRKLPAIAAGCSSIKKWLAANCCPVTSLHHCCQIESGSPKLVTNPSSDQSTSNGHCMRWPLSLLWRSACKSSVLPARYSAQTAFMTAGMRKQRKYSARTAGNINVLPPDQLLRIYSR